MIETVMCGLFLVLLWAFFAGLVIMALIATVGLALVIIREILEVWED